MRFRFCGDLDCPDWVLAQIQNLSKLTSVKLKLIVAQVVDGVIAKEPKLEKLSNLSSAAKFDEEDVKAATAALYFILTTAAKYDTSSASLSSELQQLGLPKEHSTSLSKVYSDKLDDLRSALRMQSFRLNRLASVSHETKTGLSSKGLRNPGLKYATIRLNVVSDFGDSNMVNVSLTRPMLDSLIEDLERIEKTMGKMNK